MESAHQTPIGGKCMNSNLFNVDVCTNRAFLHIHCQTDVTLTLFPFLKRRAFANPIAMNEDSIKGFITAVFNSRRNKKETSTRRLTGSQGVFPYATALQYFVNQL